MFFIRGLLASSLLTIPCVFSTLVISPYNETREAHRLLDGVELRILPLHDSSTGGFGSDKGNGYHWPLVELLSGSQVTIIGSQKPGAMTNDSSNNNERYSGALISEIEVFADTSLALRPNLVLVLAGTNDIDKSVNLADAPERVGSLIDKILSNCPDAVILVAQIPPMKDYKKNVAVQIFNAAIPGIVESRAAWGAKILTVDLSALTADDLSDDIHPNQNGFNKISEAWFSMIKQAAAMGWILEPTKIANKNLKARKTFAWDSKFGTIATGAGKGDSAFKPSWQAVGKVANGGVGFNVDGGLSQNFGVRLADLDGDGRDDYLWVHPSTGAVTLLINGGYRGNEGVNWIAKGVVASGMGDSQGVIFADINGDGRDDYLSISFKDGLVTAYINGGEQADGKWSWTSLGVITDQGVGGTRRNTRFADIDGDGRADYIIVGSDGSLTAWLNLGLGDVPKWYPLGRIATGIGKDDQVFLHDLNNDGRADYIWVAPNGAAIAYINSRGGSAGLIPNWINAGEIATGVGIPGHLIMFGDVNGDGKTDYLTVQSKTGALDAWFNAGSGGSFVVGDGTRFADMDGDGLDDYLAISPNGAIDLWRNRGYDRTTSRWIWESQGQIATGVAARRNIRIADLDGDGLVDYLIVDENSGAVIFWRNGGRLRDGSWGWTNNGQVIAGVGAGAGVRFADINGDGLDDYLWVAKNGSVTAFINGGGGSDGWIWQPQGIITAGVGGARQDVRFHDIDGDGLADYLWVNRLDGSVSEWKNGGLAANGWQWQPQGKIVPGFGANGLSIQFGFVTNSRRVDYLVVVPESGAVTQWSS